MLVVRRLSWVKAVAPRYWVMADQAVVSGTTFLTNLFLARLCGLAAFGAFSAWQLALLLVLTLQGALISQPLPVVYGETTPENRAAYRRTVALMQLGFSGAGVLLATLILLVGLHRPVGAVAAFGVCILAVGGLDTARKLLLTEGHVRAALLADVLSGGLQLLVLLGWSLRGTVPSVTAVLWVVGLTTVPALVVAVGALRLGFGPAQLAWFGRRHGRQVRWLLPTAVLQWSAANGLLVFVGVAGPPAGLGILRLAQTVMGVFNVGLQAVENYALPRLSQSFRSAPTTFERQRTALGRTLLAVGAPALALLFVSAGPVVRWLQPDAASYAHVLRWCCGLYLTILLVYPLRLTVRLVGEGRPYFIGYVLSVAVSLVGARPLVAHWGASGVVMGWLLAQVVLGGYWAWAVRDATRTAVRQVLISLSN
jgi:O-antigen/teichoic acid export membrane protein